MLLPALPGWTSGLSFPKSRWYSARWNVPWFQPGLYIQLPHGYECQIRPRSGLAIKHGISLVNTPGTVDSDYRGEIGVILVNLSNEPFTVNDGERICQMVITRYTRVDWERVERIDETERGKGGFGHTGVQ